MRYRVLAAFSVLVLLIFVSAGAGSASDLRFPREAFSTERLVRYLKIFSSEPHVASSPRNNELARLIASEWKSFGLDDVRLAEYDVLLSFPERVIVEIVSPRRLSLPLREDPVPADPDTGRPDLGLPYNAYSASGEVTAPVVYANNGNPQDFDALERNGIDLLGKIALVRYSEPYSYRGFKALTAQRRGLAALLIYSDPKDDGAARGPVFPDGPWGPMSHIQRGGIPFDFIYPGDPLTPGLPSIPGTKRLTAEESATLPKIISVPISARDALPLFQEMGGDPAPAEWAGALPVAYRLGGRACRVHIDVRMDSSVRKIINVIGSIRGGEEPDSVVLAGNHRDAWVFGGLDPSSGTACLMELARAFGEAKKAGFRPRRSIYFASWDAEEFTLTGSTEWGEENREWLRKGLVAYLNVDSSASGRNFNVSASPCLSGVILRAIRETAEPIAASMTGAAMGRSVYDAWMGGPKARGTIATASGSGRINPIGSGSDHTVFLNHICAPALDMSFSGDYGVYHSAYDDYYWMSHFGDPGMNSTKALDEIWARMIVDLADSPVVPMDYETYASELITWLEEWAGRFDPERKSLTRLVKLAGDMKTAASKIPRSAAGIEPEARLRANGLLIEVERSFALQAGIPDRTWFKHLVFGTRSTYEALLLPELTEAAEAGNSKGVTLAIAHLEEAVAAAVMKIGEVARLLTVKDRG